MEDLRVGMYSVAARYVEDSYERQRLRSRLRHCRRESLYEIAEEFAKEHNCKFIVEHMTFADILEMRQQCFAFCDDGFVSVCARLRPFVGMNSREAHRRVFTVITTIQEEAPWFDFKAWDKANEKIL